MYYLTIYFLFYFLEVYTFMMDLQVSFPLRLLFLLLRLWYWCHGPSRPLVLYVVVFLVYRGCPDVQLWSVGCWIVDVGIWWRRPHSRLSLSVVDWRYYQSLHTIFGSREYVGVVVLLHPRSIGLLCCILCSLFPLSIMNRRFVYVVGRCVFR